MKAKTEAPERLEVMRPTKGAKIRKRLVESWPWYLMALVPIIYTLIFDYASMYGVVMAFQDFKASKRWRIDRTELVDFPVLYSCCNHWRLHGSHA